jgi:protein TonB
MTLDREFSVISPQNRLAFTLIIAFLFHSMLALGFKNSKAQPVEYFGESVIEVSISVQNQTKKVSKTPSSMIQNSLAIPPEKIPELIAEDERSTDSMTGILKTIPSNRENKETPKKKLTADKLLPTAKQLISRSLAMANLHGEIQDSLKRRDSEVRHKYISANTKEHNYAAYMEAWRAKVERIGNMNYPNRAREKGLSGSLLLDVAIRSDGSVKEIIIRRSSGHDLLDSGAVKIVRLAAPFAPFPDQIKGEVDILHVTRNWKFVNDQRPTD